MSATLITDERTQRSQHLLILHMHRQIVKGCAVPGPRWKGPPLESTRTRMQDLVGLGTCKARSKRYIEGQVDGRSLGRRLGPNSWRALWTSQWLRRRHVLMKSRHAEGRRSHPFPAVTGLAGEVADLVHLRRWTAPQVIDARKGEERQRGAMVVASRRSEAIRRRAEDGAGGGREVTEKWLSQRLRQIRKLNVEFE